MHSANGVLRICVSMHYVSAVIDEHNDISDEENGRHMSEHESNGGTNRISERCQTAP